MADDLPGRGRLDPFLGHHQGKRPLAPLAVLAADHRHLGDARVEADGIFQLQRGEPLAAGLDHVLDPVGDGHVVVPVDVGHVAGVQVAAAPQVFRVALVLEIALGEPGGADHELADLFAVVRHLVHLLVHQAQFHQRDRPAGGAAQVHLFAEFQVVAVHVGHGEDRAGLAHAVAGEDVDAAGHGRLAHGLAQGRAADEQLPAGEVQLVEARVVHEHVHDRGHAVGEGHALAGDQLEDGGRGVFARIDLLDAHRGGHVGHAPGVHVEHRGERHVHVFLVEAALGGRRAEGGQVAQGVQHQLAVAEVHALGHAGGAGGVEGGGPGVLVEIGELELGRGRGQEGLVFAGEPDAALRRLVQVGEQDEPFDRVDAALDLLDHRQELVVDEQVVVLGVVDGVEYLLGRQADVDGVQHRAEHGHGEKAFQVAVAVPVHHRHRVAGPDAQFGEGAGQPADPLAQVAVGVAEQVAVDDLLVRVVHHRGVEQVFDQQGIGVGGGGALDDRGGHKWCTWGEKGGMPTGGQRVLSITEQHPGCQTALRTRRKKGTGAPVACARGAGK